MNKVEQAYRSGQVTRYHALPEMNRLGQTNADHSMGMLALLYQLKAFPSAGLVEAIVTHDAPELSGGDLPYDFKKAYPEFARQHHVLSNKMHGQEEIDLAEADQKWLKFLDGLEPYLYARLHTPAVIEKPDWIAMRHALIDTAKELNCYTDELAELLPDDRRCDKKNFPDTRIEGDQRSQDILDAVMNDPELLDMVTKEIDRQRAETLTLHTVYGDKRTVIKVASLSEASEAQEKPETTHLSRAQRLQAALYESDPDPIETSYIGESIKGYRRRTR